MKTSFHLSRCLAAVCLLLPLLLRADDYDTMRARWKLLVFGSDPAALYNSLTDTTAKSAVANAVDSRNTAAYNYYSGRSSVPINPAMAATFTGGYIWSDLPLPAIGGGDTNSSANLTSTYSRLLAMVRAYATDSTNSTLFPLSHPSLYKSTSTGQAMGAAIYSALEYLYQNYYYNPSNKLLIKFDPDGTIHFATSQYNLDNGIYDDSAKPYNGRENFYDYQIDIPSSVNEMATILYDINGSGTGLPAEIRDNLNGAGYFVPDVYYNFTGANLLWECRNLIVRSVLFKNGTRLQSGINGLYGTNSGPAPGFQTPTTPHSLFTPVTIGDGYYFDGSFIQHSVNNGQDGFAYTGGYGIGLVGDMTSLFYMLQGSSNGNFSSIVGAQATFLDGILRDCYAPPIFKGEMMDMERGRTMSRFDSTSHSAGHQTVGAYVHAIEIYPSNPTLVADYSAAITYWLNQDTTIATNVYSGFGFQDIAWTAAILGQNAGQTPLIRAGHYSFPATARAVDFETDWSAGLAMHSNRLYNYESINQENLKGWNTSEGMLYLYNADQNQYSNGFWPTVDPFRLPGTTTANGFMPDQTRTSLANFVGTLANKEMSRGVAAMELAHAGSSSTTSYKYSASLDGGVDHTGDYISALDWDQYGRKAWFFLADKIVALGAGICDANDDQPAANFEIETTVENRKLNSAGTNAFTVMIAGASGTTQPASSIPSQANLSNVTYAHLYGSVSSGTDAKTRGDIGYYFPTPANVKVLRETRQYTWGSINHGSTRVQEKPDPVSESFLTMWFDHGVKPGFNSSGVYTPASAGSYAYAILPNFALSDVQNFAAAPDFKVLENSVQAQAIRQTSAVDASVHTGAVFWQNSNGVKPSLQVPQWSHATKTVAPGLGSITSSSNALVFTTLRGATLDVSVADPTQPVTPAPFTVVVNQKVATSYLNTVQGNITVTACDPLTLSVAAGSAGAGQNLTATISSSTLAECESLARTLNGGATAQTITDTTLSNGSGVQMPCTSLSGSPSIDFTINLPTAGIWHLRVGHRTDAASGSYTASLPQANHTLKTSVDLYSTASDYIETDLGTYNFNSSGAKILRFTPTAKNSQSSSYGLTFDYIILTQ